jgi:multidrug efflux pump subunit AcrA (membrane-fusion protein)
MKIVVYRSILTLLVTAGLAGCSAFSNATPTPLPTIVLEGGPASPQTQPAAEPGGVTASGVVVPSQAAQLAFGQAGQVETVDVAVGDTVQTGQVLARLASSEQMQAAVSVAELEVLNAEQALQKLSDDLPDEQASALQALKDARDALREAERKIAGFGVPHEAIDVEVARSNVALARRALEQAQKDFKPYENKPENNFTRAALLNKLSEAQKRYDSAVLQLNRLTGVIVPEFDQQQAQTDLEIAQARLKLAEERYEMVQNGPDPGAVALAQARLKTAQDQAQAARASLEDLELIAPFAGTVSLVSLYSGEWAAPGQPIVALADLAHLRVETTDLSERDVPQVEIGQAVVVYISALDLDVPGTVREIAPLADVLGGDVVYQATIDLEELPPGLRAGMSVEIQFQ